MIWVDLECLTVLELKILFKVLASWKEEASDLRGHFYSEVIVRIFF